MDATTQQQITELNAQGTQLHLQGKLSKAADCYRQALDIDAGNATSHNNLGFLLAQQRHWKEALHHLQQAVELAPKNANFLGNLGQVLAMTGSVQDGLDLLLKAANLDPANAQVWDNLGRLRLNMGDAAGAENAWRQAYRNAQYDARIITSLAGAIAMQNRHPEAIDWYRQALEINPGYADAWAQLGVSLFLRQDYGSAREILQKALSLDAANYSALRHLGYVYMSLGDTQQALGYFKTLLNYYPEATSVRLDLAVLLLSQSQNQAALEHMQYLYRNDSHNDRVVFYYGLSLYQTGDKPQAIDVWQALEQSDSPYRQKISEFVRD
ncbi:tetratricopeptide repeat protein [Methylomonas methanica]|uniref:Tetratricopeptide TPR_2 repeat-containing protein n=1 Tax=Methylomonas methanica (strain DSM 25384 / MC09) TaxID=857087 RepID=F9ZW15_METMM|nr:tetratricopeptide repeat protein [Methylomonas methanica]AEG00819.1 Tetratricopeptide TPR_2 repeat-containing protein [Methylomonas methanica MC09]